MTIFTINYEVFLFDIAFRIWEQGPNSTDVDCLSSTLEWSETSTAGLFMPKLEPQYEHLKSSLLIYLFTFSKHVTW